MKETGIIFIFTFMLYIQTISTIIISHKHHEDKLTDIPARPENSRMLNGTTIETSVKYANIAQIYYPHYPNPDVNEVRGLLCRGVLIAPKWVVTVAHCFDEVILSNTERRIFSYFVIHFKQTNASSFTGRLAWVAVATATLGNWHSKQIDKIFINDQYDSRYDSYNEVDVALIELQDAVPKNVAAPPYRIYSDLEYDSGRMYLHAQDCWTVGAGQVPPNEMLIWNVKNPQKMKVFVGNGKYCSILEEKLYRGKKHFKYNEEYLCAISNESVNPGARLCIGDDGAALVCGNGYLLGLLSRRHDSGKCEGENAYGQYIYLGNSHVYKWMSEIIYGTIQSDDVFGSDGSKESASGLVESSKAVTWVFTLISVAVTLNTYYWNLWLPTT